MEKPRDEMERMGEDRTVHGAEVNQCKGNVKTPVEHRRPALQVRGDFLEEERQRENGTLKQVKAQM